MSRICQIVCVIASILAIATLQAQATTKLNIVKPRIVLSKNVKDYLNSVTNVEWKQAARTGVEAVNRQKRLETNLLNSRITVVNGSLSHAQLLDTLPNERATRDSDIAFKILKASLFVYNGKCIQHGINGQDCETYLANKLIPSGTELGNACNEVLESRRDGHHAFRRLLSRHYIDGFYEMYAEGHLPTPRLISEKALNEVNTQTVNQNSNGAAFEDSLRNLALVQWAQFVEHDLSKPVVTSMSNGSPIECCNRDYQKLSPRYDHPACAPLLTSSEQSRYGQQGCLNYVRSALAVGTKCTFGAAEQLNQATGSLDLSQLYGFTSAAEEKMRQYKNGYIKSSVAGDETLLQVELLPLTTDAEGHNFCAMNKTTHCFMAGDSRVNNNPFSILIYTIFLRNHNRIAQQLAAKHTNWQDEALFQAAKTINIDIYRRIIVEEWLPVVVGQQTAAEILKAPKQTVKSDEEYETSNEFAVAAIRFHYSMLPDALHNFAVNSVFSAVVNNNAFSTANLFLLKDEIYKSPAGYTATKLDEILESLLNQRAMKMDASYVSGLIWHGSSDTRPTHADILAFDIQRGRDHGLQPYVKYLEACHDDVKINEWQDFEKYMSEDHVAKLRGVYNSWSDIDLIVGGIAEKPLNDSTVGPTFSCIIAEQFAKLHQRHLAAAVTTNAPELQDYKHIGGVELLCLNSNVATVPAHIFHMSSESNPLVNCVEILNSKRH